MVLVQANIRDPGAGHGQPLLMLGLGPLGRSYKVICISLLLVLGLEVFGRGYTAKHGWLPLVTLCRAAQCELRQAATYTRLRAT